MTWRLGCIHPFRYRFSGRNFSTISRYICTPFYTDAFFSLAIVLNTQGLRGSRVCVGTRRMMCTRWACGLSLRKGMKCSLEKIFSLLRDSDPDPDDVTGGDEAKKQKPKRLRGSLMFHRSPLRVLQTHESKLFPRGFIQALRVVQTRITQRLFSAVLVFALRCKPLCEGGRAGSRCNGALSPFEKVRSSKIDRLPVSRHARAIE